MMKVSDRRQGASPRFTRVCILAMMLALSLAAVASTTLGLGAGRSTRVDVTGVSTQLAVGAYDPAINADGRYVVFDTPDPTITGGAGWNVYRRDRVSNETTLVSADLSGDPILGSGQEIPAISGSGKMVAYYSSAGNIVPGDTNGLPDVFVRNMDTGVTNRVSVGPNGEQADYQGAGAYGIALDSAGDKVAFSSNADDLVVGGSVPYFNIFERDLTDSQTVQVSVDSSGNAANGHSYYPSLSSDGRFCAFASDASNLTTITANGLRHVYVHDLLTGTTEECDVAMDGDCPNGSADRPSISGDGRYVAYQSNSTEIVTTETANAVETYVYDRVLHETRLVTMNAQGVAGDINGCERPSISSDGRYVSFRSAQQNLLAKMNRAGRFQIFSCDLETGVLEGVSVSSANDTGDDHSGDDRLSGDGQHVVFGSYADNLVAGDTNGTYDIFVRDFISADPTVSVAVTRHEGQAATIGRTQDATFDVTVSNPGQLDLSTVPVAIAFDSTVWEFSAASVAPDKTSSLGAAWDDVGPLAAGQVETVTVTLHAKAPSSGVPGECTATVAGATDYYSDTAATAASSAGVVVARPPVTSISALPIGWVNHNVVFTLTASDPDAPIGISTFYGFNAPATVAYSAPTAVSADGTTTVAYLSVDVFGDAEAEQTATVLIDKTAPSIAGSATAAANGAGWHRTQVTVHFAAYDARSGVATVSRDILLASDGASQSVVGTATDAAGNVATLTVSDINVDTTPPTTTDDCLPTYTSNAAIRLRASDAVSDIASTSWTLDGTPGSGATVATSALGSHTLTYWSTDKAGNAESITTRKFAVVSPTYPTSLKLSGGPSAKLKKSYKLAGSITPLSAGGKVTIAFIRLVGKKWRGAGSATATLSGGKFSYTFKPKYKGSWKATASYGGQTTATAIYTAAPAVTKPFKVK